MFAKLKKKIENEGGAVPNADSPGKSSNRRDSVSSLPRAGSIQHLGPSPPGSVTSEESSVRDVTSSREELVALLQRKTEQCKKLEGNISDLAALIKDKSKTIEKLETSLKQADEVTNKKLQEQKEEFQRIRDKLIEGYQDDKLKLDKEKRELLEKLAAAEEYRAKYFKKEEENDEFEGLTTQELAKVKHLLLNTEESLSTCRAELEAKTHQCQVAETQVEKLTDELGPLKQRLAALETENMKLKEENSERAELVTSLTKDRSAFDKRLDEMNKEMTEKQNQIAKLQGQLSDLDGEHKTLVRNSDLQRNKTSKLLQEKDDHIDTLQERVKTLEQRISDSALSGDDRLGALQAERDATEQKLAEARQQLTEVKSTWSDKITQLEDQISHLNSKIVEDSEELANSQKVTEQMRESFHKQIEDLKAKLEDAEKRALENLELATSKDTHYEKQIDALESELSKQKLNAVDSDTQLRAKITSLEAQLRELETARDAEKKELKAKINLLEENISGATDKELKLDGQISDLEENVNKLQDTISEKEDEIKELKKKIKDKESAGSSQSSTITQLKQQISELKSEKKAAEKARDNFEKHLRVSEDEKGGLLERNAELHKQIQTLKTGISESKLEHQRTVDLKTQMIESLRKSETTARQKLETLEQQMEQNEISKAESGLYTERIDEMNSTITSLQAQLAEKSRMAAIKSYGGIAECAAAAATGTRKRKRKSRPNKRVIAKKLRHSGGGKYPMVGCDHSGDGFCQAAELTTDDVANLHSTFYSERDKVTQDASLLFNLEICKISRKRVNEDARKKSRDIRVKYFVYPQGKTRLQVCQKTFCSIFTVSSDRVNRIAQHWHKKGELRPELRGGKRVLPEKKPKPKPKQVSQQQQQLQLQQQQHQQQQQQQQLQQQQQQQQHMQQQVQHHHQQLQTLPGTQPPTQRKSDQMQRLQDFSSIDPMGKKRLDPIPHLQELAAVQAVMGESSHHQHQMQGYCQPPPAPNMYPHPHPHAHPSHIYPHNYM